MPDVAVRLIAALGYSVVRKGGMGKERGDLLCRPVEGREGGSRWSPGREKGDLLCRKRERDLLSHSLQCDTMFGPGVFG